MDKQDVCSLSAFERLREDEVLAVRRAVMAYRHGLHEPPLSPCSSTPDTPAPAPDEGQSALCALDIEQDPKLLKNLTIEQTQALWMQHLRSIERMAKVGWLFEKTRSANESPAVQAARSAFLKALEADPVQKSHPESPSSVLSSAAQKPTLPPAGQDEC